MRQYTVQAECSKVIHEVVQENSSCYIHLIELELDRLDLSTSDHFFRSAQDGKLESFDVNLQEVDVLNAMVPTIFVEGYDGHFRYAWDASMDAVDPPFEQSGVL